MNYHDQILENKAFNFVKQLIYNIALSICLILLVTLIAVWGFKLGLYEVLSDSEAPHIFKGDLVAVLPQKEYKEGDIIKFSDVDGAPVAHRLVTIYNSGGIDYYICHGDNVQTCNKSSNGIPKSWQDERDHIQSLIDENPNMTIGQLQLKIRNVQVMTKDKIEGTVQFSLSRFGTYVSFIKEHYMLFIVMIAGLWVVSTVVQNEIEMKRAWRLL